MLNASIEQLIQWSTIAVERARAVSLKADQASARARATIARTDAWLTQYQLIRQPHVDDEADSQR